MSARRCSHPPRSLRSWLAEDESGRRTVLVVVCGHCRRILRGAAPKTLNETESTKTL